MSENLDSDDFDDLEAFEAKQTSRTLPLGWIILFWGLILFGIFYAAAYSPSTTGWSQAGEYEESIKK